MRLKLLIVLLFGNLVAFGQTPKELLDEVVQRAFANGCVDVDFTVYMDDSESQGHIIVQGKQFVLETPGMKTWFDGKTQWTLVEENEESQSWYRYGNGPRCLRP